MAVHINKRLLGGDISSVMGLDGPSRRAEPGQSRGGTGA